MLEKIKSVLKMIENWFLANSVLLMLWVFISWVDIITHNLDPEPVYQAWNIFAMLF